MRSERTIATLATAAGAAMITRHVLRRRRAMDLQDKVVVITGGSRGLGLVLARQFAAEGARIALVAEHEEPLNRALMELAAQGVDVQGIVCDIRQRAAVAAAVDAIVERFGRIDVLVNNAGVIQVGPLANMEYEDFQQAMDVHYWGALHMTLAALPHMRPPSRSASASEGKPRAIRASEGKRIVNITSIGGKFPVPHLAPYTASKFALVGLSEGLRAELAPEGILVTTVAPGLMRTGSPRNISVKGNHDAEYGWFVLLGSLPLVSIGAERAAAKIVDAARYGDPSLIITPQAKAMIALEGIAPGLVGRANALVTRWLLPRTPGQDGDVELRGHESRPAWLPGAATALTDRAARRNNQLHHMQPPG
jgi:NAD(P)-dependent dehydrogenase (short-subunit alcohol dehydrogenase family)